MMAVEFGGAPNLPTPPLVAGRARHLGVSITPARRRLSLFGLLGISQICQHIHTITNDGMPQEVIIAFCLAWEDIWI